MPQILIIACFESDWENEPPPQQAIGPIKERTIPNGQNHFSSYRKEYSASPAVCIKLRIE